MINVDYKPKERIRIETEYYEIATSSGNYQIAFEKEVDRHGRIHGKFTGYHRNGEVMFIRNYARNKRHGSSKRWDTNGRLIEHENYKDGELHGKCVSYYSNGNVAEEAHYENGKRHGCFLEYWRDGPLSAEVYYKNDRLHGEYSRYSVDGNSIGTEFYIDGINCNYSRYSDYLNEQRLIENGTMDVVNALTPHTEDFAFYTEANVRNLAIYISENRDLFAEALGFNEVGAKLQCPECDHDFHVTLKRPPCKKSD
jgi:hypothetical protein